MNIRNPRKKALLLAGVVLSLLAAGSWLASAQTVDQGSSSAFDLQISASVPLVGNATIGPFVESSGSGPPDYTDPQSLAQVSLDSGSVLDGSTGLLETEADGTGLGAANGVTSASSTVDDLDVGVSGLLGLQLLSLGATTVQSTAQVSGPCGETLTATGTTTLEDAGLDISAGVVNVSATLPVSPSPNTQLVNLPGVASVILNEQSVTGDASQQLAIEVNAIHISLNVLNIITSEIVVAHSEASLICDLTPEPGANLTITKTADPSPAVVGQDLTYTLEVTNDGDASATNVTVVDTLPGSVSYQSATPDAGSCSETSGVVTCGLGTMTAGQTLSITIVVTPNSTGTITNTATATSPDDPEGDETSLDTEIRAAELSISKTADPDPVTVGEALTYTLSVTNGGNAAASNVTVIDTLPGGVSFQSATPDTGSCSESSGVVTCGLGGLAAGQTVGVTMVVIPGAAGTITNTASVTSDEDPEGDETSVDTDVTAADLSITKTADLNPATVGEELTYTLSVTNDGDATATNVVVTDTLPSSVDFVSVSPDAACAEAAGVVTCQLGTLGQDVSVMVTIVVVPQEAGTILNTAAATADNDPDGDETTLETDVETQTPPGRPTATVSPTPTSDPPVAQVTIVKQVVGGSLRAFDFTSDFGRFSLASGESLTFDLAGGTYEVREAPATGFDLLSVTCEGADWTAGVPGGARIDVQAGDEVTCLFINGRESNNVGGIFGPLKKPTPAVAAADRPSDITPPNTGDGGLR